MHKHLSLPVIALHHFLSLLQEMDGELERYHKNNSTLDLTIGDYKLKQNGLQHELLRQRTAVQDAQMTIK